MPSGSGGAFAGATFGKRFRISPISIVLGLISIYLQTRHPATIGANVVKIDPFLYRPAVVGVSTLFYLSKFFFPIGFLPIYPRWEISPPTFAEWLTVPLVGGVFLALWIYRRHDWARHTLFGLGFFDGFMPKRCRFSRVLPMLYSRISRVADHLVYLPMIGLNRDHGRGIGGGRQAAAGSAQTGEHRA